MSRARLNADHYSGPTGITDNSNANAMTIGADESVTFTGDLVPSTPLSHRNMIINGDMRVSQRGTSWTTGSGGIYTLDRWRLYENATGNLTISQDTSAPDGFSHSLKALVETVDASIGAAEQIKLQQKIEAFNTTHLAFGTSSAKDLVLSFWVKSSVTGTFGCAITNAAENRSYVKEYTISSADTWEKKTLTIAGDTSGTWVSGTNAASLHVIWSMGAGTDRENTANTWHGSIEHQTSSCTNLIETAGATWYLTGVQLELGSNATPFEHRSYGDELRRCQRYYTKISAINAYTGFASGHMGTTTQANMYLKFPTTMRAEASVTESSVGVASSSGTLSDISSLGVYCGADSMLFQANLATAQTAGQGACAFAQASSAAKIEIDVEL